MTGTSATSVAAGRRAQNLTVPVDCRLPVPSLSSESSWAVPSRMLRQRRLPVFGSTTVVASRTCVHGNDTFATTSGRQSTRAQNEHFDGRGSRRMHEQHLIRRRRCALDTAPLLTMDVTCSGEQLNVGQPSDSTRVRRDIVSKVGGGYAGDFESSVIDVGARNRRCRSWIEMVPLKWRRCMGNRHSRWYRAHFNREFRFPGGLTKTVPVNFVQPAVMRVAS